MSHVRPMSLIAMLAMTASPAASATPYELAHSAQTLRQEFADSYFANGAGEGTTPIALRKSLIHVLALALTTNATCRLGLDAEQLTRAATRLSEEPALTGFFTNAREAIAAMTGSELKRDQTGTCQRIEALYRQSEPWIELEVAQVSESAEASTRAQPNAQPVDETQIVPIGTAATTIDAAADTAVIPIAFSDATVRVPIKFDPTMPGKPLIDLERMITDESFAGQAFPDYVCPPESSALACRTMFEGSAKVLKAHVRNAYEPTDFLCQDTRANAAIQGISEYATTVQMTMLKATLAASGVEMSEDRLTFNPGGYYLYRFLMAAEVCLGIRQ